MAQQTEFSPALLDCVRTVSLRDDEILSGLRRETAQPPMGQAMRVMVEEARFLALLVALTGAYVAVVQGAPVPGRGDLPLCVAVLPLPARLPWRARRRGQRVEADLLERPAGFFRRLMTKTSVVPRVVVKDKLRSYGAAHREVMPSVEHRSHKGLNNRAENSHQPRGSVNAR